MRNSGRATGLFTNELFVGDERGRHISASLFTGDHQVEIAARVKINQPNCRGRDSARCWERRPRGSFAVSSRRVPAREVTMLIARAGDRSLGAFAWPGSG